MTQAPTYDFVIIGAGTAGCLLANRLSADPACRVLLVEAGGEDNYHWIHIPVGYLRCIGNPRTDWRYRTEREAALNGRDLLYPRGKVLGGSSSINGMIYMRGQARDYDGWAASCGDDAWSWRNALPDFLAHECSYRGAGEHHAAANEWHVSKQRLRWDILDAFAAAAPWRRRARASCFAASSRCSSGEEAARSRESCAGDLLTFSSRAKPATVSLSATPAAASATASSKPPAAPRRRGSAFDLRSCKRRIAAR